MFSNRYSNLQRVGFARLVDDHIHIESSISALLDDLKEDAASPHDIAVQLDALAIVIRKHLREESDVIQHTRLEILPDTWRETWVEGEAALLQLKVDWSGFVDHWTESRISNDMPGFSYAANAILSRLSDRVKTETQCFYKTALSAGSIEY
ncbi:hypothetical protein KV697_00875 [Sphingomonas sanguinis]|uniref:hypothetical protein n=1 Tax=Sphingomonas sanguinis TaxID=33051 RepID=UPI001C586060|nr:hypothetical protein [Sphingomonas sanguinis]QXT35985.1 hypothetical protein KV697_00875 [Sphingomonas sanguinis]